MVELGQEVEDVITGFRGIAVGIVDYISGCRQILISARADKEGKTPQIWADEQRCQLVPGGRRIQLQNAATPGFDSAAPKR